MNYTSSSVIRNENNINNAVAGENPTVIELDFHRFEIYQAIKDDHDGGTSIGPAFLGHLVAHGRVMGFLIEKVQGRYAHIGDLEACQAVTKCLHSLGIVHGDLDRYSFIVSPVGVTLIDFENATQNGSKEAMEKEYKQIAEQLMEETGRGGGLTEWNVS